ncbi:MAG: undecaprenyldiphospho-muramoylpentapeptide beta-N-acetylglucosaminyltransferase [Proteobacteria bacterium]|nr:undecaprenyldiphospho-muramoylpentapeptide beta-N-acetylglucosaminyltransferase [Pseudomonadota bacterium]
MTDKFNLIIAGGKTGGHLFPGIAVAQALKAQYPKAKILFVGTDAPFEVSTLKTYGFDHKTIISRPIKGGSLLNKLYSMALILVSLVQALAILTRFKADFVLGVGGFSSFAVVLAAWILRIPRAIQEQNSIPGITNRLLSRFAGSIFTAFETTRGMTGNPKTNCVGNPIRRTTPTENLETPMDIHPDDFVILVTGGSQGAASINRAFVQSIKHMDNLDRVYIIHQTGLADEATIRQAYGQLSVRRTVRAFFQNMPALQDKASLAIARAGASTVSELNIKGLPAILVPFPHAADDHQTFNARILEEKGAAIVIADKDLKGSALKDTLQTLLADREKLKQMGIAAKKLAMPDADKIIATIILNTKNLGV